MPLLGSELLKDEEGIVWLESPERFDYVRERLYTLCRCRRRPPGRNSVCWDGGRIVGFAVLKAEAESDDCGYFSRRVFWISPFDRSEDKSRFVPPQHARPGYPTGVYRTGCPSDAVDPRTVAPRIPGRQTERAIGIAGKDAHLAADVD